MLPVMSLRAKIALGVLAATAVLAVALAVLGLDAKQTIDQSAELHQKEVEARYTQFAEEQNARAVKAVEDLVLAWVDEVIALPPSEIAERLGEENNGLQEASIVEIEDDGTLYVQTQKPAGSKLELNEDEEAAVREVFKTGRYKFVGNTLFHPYQASLTESKPRYALRMVLDIPPARGMEPPEVQKADLGPVWMAAFITLGMAMLAVFILLSFALKRFVLAPLGDVLENSKRIVTGSEGVSVEGVVKGAGDIETMVTAFNAMFAELKDYQRDLEGKVNRATQTIQAQQQSLVIAQRLAATGTMAAGLAHEVNNPLSGMQNAARRLKKREGLDERARDYIDLIEEGLDRIAGLMKQILDFSRRRDMKPERFPAEVPYERSVKLIRHRLDRRTQKLEEDIHPELPRVYGNEEEIGQVLMNLMINASDAAPESGAIRVSIQPTDDGGVEYSVEDSGDGVPEDIRDSIFDPFFTTKEPGKGTGLGLSIVHTIVDNHAGAIRIEDGEVLGGAKFIVTLPNAGKGESTRRLMAGN